MTLYQLIRARRRNLLPLAAVIGACVFGAGCPTSGSGPLTVNHRFLFAANTADNTLTQFEMDPSTGALKKVATVPTGRAPSAVIQASAGAEPQFVYVANSGDNTISEYLLNGSGKLQPLSPPTVPTGNDPVAFMKSPLFDTLVAVVNKGSNTVTEFTPNTAGQLVSFETLTTGSSPVAAMYFGGAQYVVCAGDQTLREYRKDKVFTGWPTTASSVYPVGKAPADIGGYGDLVTFGVGFGILAKSDIYVTNSGSNTITSFPMASNGASGNLPSNNQGMISGASVTTPFSGTPLGLSVFATSNVPVDGEVMVASADGNLVEFTLLAGSHLTPKKNGSALAGARPSAVVTTLLTSNGVADTAVYVANSAGGTVSMFRAGYSASGASLPPIAIGPDVVSGNGVSALAIGQSYAPTHGGAIVPIN